MQLAKGKSRPIADDPPIAADNPLDYPFRPPLAVPVRRDYLSAATTGISASEDGEIRSTSVEPEMPRLSALQRDNVDRAVTASMLEARMRDIDALLEGGVAEDVLHATIESTVAMATTHPSTAPLLNVPAPRAVLPTVPGFDLPAQPNVVARTSALPALRIRSPRAPTVHAQSPTVAQRRVVAMQHARDAVQQGADLAPESTTNAFYIRLQAHQSMASVRSEFDVVEPFIEFGCGVADAVSANPLFVVMRRPRVESALTSMLQTLGKQPASRYGIFAMVQLMLDAYDRGELLGDDILGIAELRRRCELQDSAMHDVDALLILYCRFLQRRNQYVTLGEARHLQLIYASFVEQFLLRAGYTAVRDYLTTMRAAFFPEIHEDPVEQPASPVFDSPRPTPPPAAAVARAYAEGGTHQVLSGPASPVSRGPSVTPASLATWAFTPTPTRAQRVAVNGTVPQVTVGFTMPMPAHAAVAMHVPPVPASLPVMYPAFPAPPMSHSSATRATRLRNLGRKCISGCKFALSEVLGFPCDFRVFSGIQSTIIGRKLPWKLHFRLNPTRQPFPISGRFPCGFRMVFAMAFTFFRRFPANTHPKSTQKTG